MASIAGMPAFSINAKCRACSLEGVRVMCSLPWKLHNKA